MKSDDGKTVGMELHYKLIITKQKTGVFGTGGTDTIVVVGYKIITNVLDIDAAHLPSKRALNMLEF
jgi:hypothetical protein